MAKLYINPTAPISDPDICVICNLLAAAVVSTILRYHHQIIVINSILNDI